MAFRFYLPSLLKSNNAKCFRGGEMSFREASPLQQKPEFDTQIADLSNPHHLLYFPKQYMKMSKCHLYHRSSLFKQFLALSKFENDLEDLRLFWNSKVNICFCFWLGFITEVLMIQGHSLRKCHSVFSKISNVFSSIKIALGWRIPSSVIHALNGDIKCVNFIECSAVYYVSID